MKNAIALSLLLALPSGWIVLDPSGESREVLIVLGGRAYRVQTTPIVGEAPTDDEGELPPQDPVPDTFGFVSAARSAAPMVDVGTRRKLAGVYRSVASEIDQANRSISQPNIDAMVSDAILGVGLDPAQVRGVHDALWSRLVVLWGDQIKTMKHVVQAFREMAYGLESSQ